MTITKSHQAVLRDIGITIYQKRDMSCRVLIPCAQANLHPLHRALLMRMIKALNWPTVQVIWTITAEQTPQTLRQICQEQGISSLLICGLSLAQQLGFSGKMDYISQAANPANVVVIESLENLEADPAIKRQAWQFMQSLVKPSP